MSFTSEDRQLMQFTLNDITERKKVQAEILHEKNFSETVLSQLPGSFYMFTRDGSMLRWNAQLERVTGYSAEEIHRLIEVLGRDRAKLQDAPITGLIHPDDRAMVVDRHTRRLKGEKGIPGTYTFRVLNTDGTIRIVQLSTVRVEWSGMPATLNFLRDITDVRHLEEMMIQNEKMLTVGGLAAGMAHEINNPLAGVIQTANVMASRLTNLEMPANLRAAAEIGVEMEAIRAFVEKRGLLDMLSTIRESGSRIAEIVSNMLGFARKGDAQRSTFDLNQLIDRSLELAETDYSLKKEYDFKKIEIVREYGDDLPMILCEGTKIQQVLLNIFTNGAQAMQEAETQTPRFLVRTLIDRDHEQIAIHIADNGPGMDGETRKRVFEPFFTTKPAGIGTGLGLSISHFIITENHGGEMTVRSPPGSGAEFIIRLPLHPPEA